MVRGVLPLPQHRDLVRVVVWDGTAPTTSRAYDVPLLDPDGNDVPAAELVAAVRQLVRHSPGDRPPAPAGPRDGHGIPVVPVDTVRKILDAHPAALDLSDALYAAAAGIAPSRDTAGDTDAGTGSQDGLVLLGFLLLDKGRERARLYVTGGGLPGTVGLDVGLRDRHGAVISAITGLSAALPSLIADDQLSYNPSDETDPYCATVFDLTHW
ncbi:hypothetical protein OHS33_34735 [Streptomyces sp. NBC_00536]|uniref:hypothetical protein n=1 Tax=Streptomyces sp. NBC_00536 TaxID=2975769 RepID=UPI002E807EB1|nr:hypothetical protein [Streptomyces sp. NBC_00536]WUC83075.1 hypothetical protein OHS33_34735 [Streptomyces sp. NBC_00536]